MKDQKGDTQMERFQGRKIKYDIDSSLGVTLVPAGTVLNLDHLDILKNHDIDRASITFVSEAENELQQSINQIVQSSKKLFQSIDYSRKIPLIEIRNEVLPVVKTVSKHPNVFQLFQAVKATDEYTYHHNIGVGVLATLLGRWLQLTDTEINILSLAAVLHDVGKLRVTTEILNKPGKLSAEEYEIIKKHTIFGYELLKDTVGLNYRIPLVALQHHERNDGKGYPFGLQQDKIDYFSKIVAVADIFHAMSSKRPYHAPIAFHEIVSQMRHGIFGELDPHIVSVFLDNIVKRMVGETVKLTDGSVGEVVYLNPHNIEAPLIKINDAFIDLSNRTDLRITEISI